MIPDQSGLVKAKVMMAVTMIECAKFINTRKSNNKVCSTYLHLVCELIKASGTVFCIWPFLGQGVGAIYLQTIYGNFPWLDGYTLGRVPLFH